MVRIFFSVLVLVVRRSIIVQSYVNTARHLIMDAVEYVTTPSPLKGECQMDQPTDCSLDHLTTLGSYESYYVTPPSSAKARCIDGKPYRFQVFPGSLSEVILFFQEVILYYMCSTFLTKSTLLY